MSDQAQPPSQEQPTLFDDAPPTGEQLRDAGIGAVLAADSAPHRDYRVHVDAVLVRLAATGRPFTSDDVWDGLPADVRDYVHPNLIGASVRTTSGRGEIECLGLATSGRPSRHKGAVRLWRGTTSNSTELRSA